MPRQSITLTEPNNNWLEEQVASKEYTSKSELVNSLIRQARNTNMQIDFIREKLIEGEKSGFTNKRFDEFLEDAKARKKKLKDVV